MTSQRWKSDGQRNLRVSLVEIGRGYDVVWASRCCLSIPLNHPIHFEVGLSNVTFKGPPIISIFSVSSWSVYHTLRSSASEGVLMHAHNA
jgi:hypothetical protein